ncbi:transcriptional enhancer factor TEF-5 [Trichechus manatus latirostris]|uniref:Transcriptional enhancer factor TEF-5 n=1 Tax=Trichechus manatus latirostris TaxID=127582 RepID=A0A2Y9G553_TRIMA|nr:transcriptional enhancer factor TEF-5 [Trichechus manatus latirostris]
MKNIWSWSCTSGRRARLPRPSPPRAPVTSCPGAVVGVVLTPSGTALGLLGAGAGSEEGVSDEGLRPGTRIPNKAAYAKQSGGSSGRAASEATGGVRRAGCTPSPTQLPPRPRALPRPLPRALGGSYRNSAGAKVSRRPPRGPRAEREAPEVREEGERGKFEKQATRGEPDKPGPGEAGAAARAGPGLGPREWGAGCGQEGALRPGDSGLEWVEPRSPCAPARPGFSPEPQILAGHCGGGGRPSVQGKVGSVALAGEVWVLPCAEGGERPELPRARRSGPAGAPPRARTRMSCPVGSGPEPRATSTIASNSWNASSSPGEAREDGPEGLDKGLDNDAEGVWSPDIEQSFQEALAIYPPCGRRKIILSDEGKMYGRNELIARYIKLRTGKTRTRKQVSSHIQVLARKKVREYQVGIKAMNLDQVSKDKALQSMASMSSAQIVSASVLQNKFSPPSPLPQAVFSSSSRFWSSPPLLGQQPGPSQDIKPFAQPAYPIQPPLPPTLSSYEPLAPLPPAAASVPVWQDRTIASSRLRLLEYSAFMEVQRDPDTYSKHLFVHIGQTNPAFSDPPLEAVDVRQIYDKFPEKKGGLKELYEKGPPNAFFLVKFWADLNSTIQEGPGAFYGVSSQYSSADSMTISVSTKVCSFGKQVVEKVETEYARLENGRFVYRIHRSPMCEYMINFIHKLKHLPEKYMMNSVLENFTILQVVTSRDSQETLLVIAFVFEVSTSEHGAQHHVYKLVKD